MTTIDRLDAIISIATGLGLTPMPDDEIAHLNALLDARAQARLDELDDRLKSMTAIVTEGEAV